MSRSAKPVQLFVCYSHKDRRHLDKLRAHLSGLEREGRIHCWWDGEIEVGSEWEPELLSAMRSADLVLLLLTANLLSSDYCIDTELKAAREREREGRVDLVPILVESFDLSAHWLGRLQAISANGKSIVASRLGSVAWENVARQIRMKVECLEGKRPVMQALDEVQEVIYSGDVQLEEWIEATQPRKIRRCTVGEFWRAEPRTLHPQDIVQVDGTISQFAPMLMGPPHAKRVLHREFRKAIETHRHFGERKRLTINACMSVSSGQMVHRAIRAENRKHLLGLYESIVRNALPVFVLPEYFEAEVAPMLNDTNGDGCFQATVTGRLFLLDNSYIRRFFVRQGIDRILPHTVIDELCRDSYALEVGMPGTSIERLKNVSVPYLDGDIWIAARMNGAERFITAFVDIANGEERRDEMTRMRSEAGDSEIIVSYDELESVAQLLSKSSR